jgi:hypothetical protein
MKTTDINSACMACDPLSHAHGPGGARARNGRDRIPRVLDETPSRESVRLGRPPGAAPESGAGAGQGSPHPDVEGSGAPARELWSSRIAAPQTSEDVDASLALKRLIRQVRSVRSTARTRVPRSPPPRAAACGPGQTWRRNPPESRTPEPSSSSVGPGHPQPASSRPRKAQKTLEAPARISPTRCAIRSKWPNCCSSAVRPPRPPPSMPRRSTASPHSIRATTRIGPGFSSSSATASARPTPPRAQEAYTRLISEYPDSPWTELARAHGRLLAWYRKSPTDQLATLPQL